MVSIKVAARIWFCTSLVENLCDKHRNKIALGDITNLLTINIKSINLQANK